MSEVGKGRRLVRLRDDGFEMRCDACLEWYPVLPEYWPRRPHGLTKCRACLRAYFALKQRGYVADRRELKRLADAERRRLETPAERQRRLDGQRRWRQANRDRIRDYMATYRARRENAA